MKGRFFLLCAQVLPMLLALSCSTAPRPCLSPDGQHRALVEKRGGIQYVVRDGVRGKGYKKVFLGSLTFDPAGERLAYVAQAAEKRFLVVMDSVEGPEHDEIQLALKFSPDGRTLGYAAKDGEKWRVFLDGRPGSPYDLVHAKMIRHSGDGSRIAYPARDSTGYYVVIQNRERGAEVERLGPYEDLTPPALSYDGTHLAYAIRRGDVFSMVVDGVEEMLATSYGKGTPLFNADGSKVGYTALVMGHWLLVINGEILTVISGEASEREFVAAIEEAFVNPALHRKWWGTALLLADPYTRFTGVNGRSVNTTMLELAPGPQKIKMDLTEVRGSARGVDLTVDIPAGGIYMVAFESEQYGFWQQTIQNLAPSLNRGWKVGKFKYKGLWEFGNLPQRWMTILVRKEQKERQVLGILEQRWRPIEVRLVAAQVAADMLAKDRLDRDRGVALLSELVADESEDGELRRTVWTRLLELGLDSAVEGTPAGL